MVRVEVQDVCGSPDVPSLEQFLRWAGPAVSRQDSEVVIRIVDDAESAALNQRYRHKNGPTNVLSFHFQVPPGIPNQLLGDLVICAPLVRDEAARQGKPLEAHWAHLTVHGLLHLQGFDHVDESDAALMEAEEIAILEKLGIPNPYREEVPSWP
jgi:probable rRNA maturation factor